MFLSRRLVLLHNHLLLLFPSVIPAGFCFLWLLSLLYWLLRVPNLLSILVRSMVVGLQAICVPQRVEGVV